jgi:hypothetical protein
MIRGQVTGGWAAAEAVSGIGERLRQPLGIAMGVLAGMLMRDFVGARLKSSSGRLAASLRAVPERGGGRDGVVVKALAPQAAFVEYGFDGVENLRGFLRLQKQAWGRAMRVPRQVWVGPHARQVSSPAHSYLRAGLEDFETSGCFGQGVADAIGGVVR